MKYKKIYRSLIRKAKNRDLNTLDYYENHHILPKCFGGEETVALTAREHYIAHLLLIKIYPNNRKLLQAVLMMCSSNEFVIRNNKMYEWVRKRWSENQSKFMKENNPIHALTEEQEKSRVEKAKKTFKENKKKGKHKKPEYTKEEKKARSKRMKENHPMKNNPSLRKKFSKFMKENNPMFIEEHREKLKKKVSKKEILLIISLYLEGYTFEEITNITNHTLCVLKRILVENNIKLRTGVETKALKKIKKIKKFK